MTATATVTATAKATVTAKATATATVGRHCTVPFTVAITVPALQSDTATLLSSPTEKSNRPSDENSSLYVRTYVKVQVGGGEWCENGLSGNGMWNVECGMLAGYAGAG